MMVEALGYLLWAGFKGRLRRMARDLRKPARAVFFVAGVLFFATWVGFLAISTIGGGARPPAGMVRPFAELYIQIMFLFTLAGAFRLPGLAFTPGEVTFLFPGPFRRREIVLFYLLRSDLPALLSGLFLALLFLPYSGGAIGWIPAILLLNLFLTHLGAAVSLLVGGASAKARRRAWRILYLLGLGMLLVFLGGLTIGGETMTRGVPGMLVLGLQALTLPCRPFVELALGAGPAVAGWGALSLGLVVATAALVVRFDRDFTEGAIRASETVRTIREQVRRRGVVHRISRGWIGTRTLPPWPVFRGAGALVWRHGIEAIRQTPSVLLSLIPLVFLFFIYNFLRMGPRTPGGSWPAVIGSLVFLSIFMAGTARWDFRGDYSFLESLKSLPLSSFGLGFAQVIVPALYLSLLQGVMFLVLALLGSVPPADPFLVAAVALGFPFLSFFLVAVDNLAFLLHPTRGAATGESSRFAMIGLHMLLFAVKSLAIGVVLGVALAIGWVLSALAGLPLPAAIAGGLFPLFAANGLILALVGVAFERLDPSRLVL